MLFAEARLAQQVFRQAAGVAFVVKANGPIGYRGEPITKSPGLARFGTFIAAGIDWQANNKSRDLLLLREFLEEFAV